MCTAFEETRREAVYREKKEMAMRLLARGKDTVEEIAELTLLSVEEIKELAEPKTA